MPRPATALRRPRRLHDAAVRRPSGFVAATRVDPSTTGRRGGTLSFLVEDAADEDEDTTLPWLSCQRTVSIDSRGRAIALEGAASAAL